MTAVGSNSDARKRAAEGQPLCTCGHPGGDHENDGSGACYRLERGPCMCEKFTPPARARAAELSKEQHDQPDA